MVDSVGGIVDKVLAVSVDSVVDSVVGSVVDSVGDIVG